MASLFCEVTRVTITVFGLPWPGSAVGHIAMTHRAVLYARLTAASLSVVAMVTAGLSRSLFAK